MNKRMLFLVLFASFIFGGCNSMQTRQSSESNDGSDEKYSNWSLEYIQPSTKADLAYKDKRKPGNRIPFDGVVVKSGKNEGGRVEVGFIQNDVGDNIAQIQKTGETTGRALLKGGANIVRGATDGLVSAFIIRDGLKQIKVLGGNSNVDVKTAAGAANNGNVEINQ
jgi:hypothetical protein